MKESPAYIVDSTAVPTSALNLEIPLRIPCVTSSPRVLKNAVDLPIKYMARFYAILETFKILFSKKIFDHVRPRENVSLNKS